MFVVYLETWGETMKKILFLLLLFTLGCSKGQLKNTNSIYENLHSIRMGIESIEGLKLAVDIVVPWAANVRSGLDETYTIKHMLLPEIKLEEASQ